MRRSKTIRETALAMTACGMFAGALAGCGSGAPASAAASTTRPARTRPAVSGHAQMQRASRPSSERDHRPAQTASSAPPPPRSRPREQLDATSSQLEALYAPYDSCLARHVSPSEIKRFAGHHIHILPYKMAGPAGLKACLPYKPLPPWQYDPTNPKALGFVEQVVACLHQNGVRYAQVIDRAGVGEIEISLGGSHNDSSSVSKGMADIPMCDQKVLRAERG